MTPDSHLAPGYNHPSHASSETVTRPNAAMSNTFSHHVRLPILGFALSETSPRYSAVRQERPRWLLVTEGG